MPSLSSLKLDFASHLCLRIHEQQTTHSSFKLLLSRVKPMLFQWFCTKGSVHLFYWHFMGKKSKTVCSSSWWWFSTIHSEYLLVTSISDQQYRPPRHVHLAFIGQEIQIWVFIYTLIKGTNGTDSLTQSSLQHNTTMLS